MTGIETNGSDLLPSDVVLEGPLCPLPRVFGKIECEWAISLFVRACTETNSWREVPCDELDKLMNDTRGELRGNPFYRPDHGFMWARKHGFIKLSEDGQRAVITATALERLALHTPTADRMDARLKGAA